MKIPPVKGTRDFYPPEMAVRNWITDGWRQASLRSGFEEYDGPIFEHLQMYQIKSGDEIVEQLFSLQDRGGRDLAIRPEITPTLARMVNQRINTLARPIKWFSMPRLCRAERPQKGRLREFFQWNLDIIGEPSPLADAEVIFATVDYLRSVGLTANDVKVRLSSRRLLASVLGRIGIPPDQLQPLYALLDKKPKLPGEVFAEMLAQQVPDVGVARKINAFMDLREVGGIAALAGADAELEQAQAELAQVLGYLTTMGVAEFCLFDPGIVRGLAYYTGVVFEVHDAVGDLRAICGGGRYDNLLADFGGPQLTATGMGMGDCVLEILLREKGLFKDGQFGKALDYFVACVPRFATEAGRCPQEEAVRLTAEIRRHGLRAEFSYKAGGLGKKLKEAADSGAARCIIIGDELPTQQKLAVKDLATGQQELVDYEAFLAGISCKK